MLLLQKSVTRTILVSSLSLSFAVPVYSCLANESVLPVAKQENKKVEWYQSPWAYTAYGIVGIGLLAGGVYGIYAALNGADGNNSGSWIQVGSDIGGLPNEGIGNSLSMSKDGQIIGMTQYSDLTQEGGFTVYKYNNVTQNWQPFGNKYTEEDSKMGGISLSSSGDTFAFGLQKYWDGSLACAVKLKDGNWSDFGETNHEVDEGIDDSCFAPEDMESLFGASVSMSSNGERIAVGAPADDFGGNKSGLVSVYQYNPTGNFWGKLGKNIAGEASGDHSGHAVSLSPNGETLAVGAPNNDRGGENAGHVRVYQFDRLNGEWIQIGSDINGESAKDYLGSSLSISEDGRVLAVGAPGHDEPGGVNHGLVKVYKLQGNSWNQIGKDIIGEESGEMLGMRNSISLSSDGSKVAVGSFKDGAAKIFELKDGEWKYYGKQGDLSKSLLKADETGPIGSSVSLSGSGNRVIIGAPQFGLNGEGIVRAFDYMPN